MAKASVSRQWFIAVDGEKDFLRQKWNEYRPPSGVVEKLFVVSHSGSTGDNPHVHVLLQESIPVQKQSLDARLKKLFNIDNAKTSHYSSKVWDGNTSGEGAGSYLFHEERAEILVNNGISEDDIVVMRKANQAVQKVVAMNKERASGKIVERALQHFANVPRPEYYEDHKWLSIKTDILEWMYQQCKQGKSYYPGQYKLKQYVEEVELRLMDDKSLRKLAERLAQKFWE